MTDKLKKEIISKLEKLAKQHPNRHIVNSQVFQKLKTKHNQRVARWSMFAFTLVATITGITLFPHATVDHKSDQSTINQSQKLSPQLADDLEMLLVLGEDSKKES